MGYDRNPMFGRRSTAPVEDDELSQTYTNLLVLVDKESLSPSGPSKAVLNLMVSWMGAAKGRLAALTAAKVAERFPVLEERVRNLKMLVIGQWAALLFLAGVVLHK